MPSISCLQLPDKCQLHDATIRQHRSCTYFQCISDGPMRFIPRHQVDAQLNLWHQVPIGKLLETSIYCVTSAIHAPTERYFP